MGSRWLLVVWAFAACGGPEPVADEPDVAAHVGSGRCASCHAEQAALWRGSHHDLAMQEASPSTVLGDLEGAEVEHFGVTSTFFRRGDELLVRTDGPDGALDEFPVAYTFGVDPLQQYLVRLPDGRLQALGLAWDARAQEEGGQRWFSLHPDEAIPHDDVLHWTGTAQSWNAMCASCHSTGVEKGYDVETDRYETTWEEIDVGCEACHGPGSAHVTWAESGEQGDARGLTLELHRRGEWTFEVDAAIAHRGGPAGDRAEIETCAPCHSRRSEIATAVPGAPFLDTHRPALLDEDLYFADGQIQDEVYVWGSFLQSRMHAAGVTCSDCHDPHALRIEEPDRACARCHRPEVFTSPTHHHHELGSPGASCVACHMRARTYMVIDARRDHSFRVPRPDLTAKIGVPNACDDCHAERGPHWAVEVASDWWGEPRRAHWGPILHAGRLGLAGAQAALVALAGDDAQPGIVRATALRLLGRRPDVGSVGALERGRADADPLVRLAAAGLAEVLPADRRWLAARDLLRDPVRAVRIEAARVLASVSVGNERRGDRAALARALEEYRSAQLLNADRAEAHVSLGMLYVGKGDLERAEREYRTALRLNPWFVPAYVNLADLARLRGRDAEGEHLLQRALERAPESAAVHHALGLLLVRLERREAGLVALERAAELAPEAPRYVYVYAVGLHSMGQLARARSVLEAASARHPEDPSIGAFLEQLRAGER